ncbi:hypothetical protein Pcinc_036765 [Petrolisthes cinctipes]|uniref:Uncharacterized protein n=1 Tax=Petrolisthes cinctipes TaxID=88211 RepID=A0AAE1EPE4_PETCI|nr:hypothetical protein Pcinc_036765 [Petrolisthes cinctipes]
MCPRWVVTLLVLFSLLVSGSRSLPVNFEFVELRQVLLDSDPSGTNHNLRVLLKELSDPIDDSATWTLILYTTDMVQEDYDCTPTNAEQPTLLCEGNLVNSSAIILSAEVDKDTTGFGYALVNIEDMMSRVAWVGKDTQAMLRVHTGSMDEIQVDGQHTCTDSTCYYPRSEFADPDALKVERCTDISYDGGSITKTLKHCDEIVATPPQMEDPDLLLSLDQQNSTGTLTLTHNNNNPEQPPASVELLLLQQQQIPEEDDTILVEDCITDDEDNTCSTPVTLQQDSDVLQRTVNLINKDGYVTSTTTFSMEVYQVITQRLTETSLEVRWDKASPDTYLVNVSSSSLLVPCDNNTSPCLTFFTNLILTGPSVTVSLQKKEEQKVVETTLILADPPETNAAFSKLSRVSQDPPVSKVTVTETETNGVLRDSRTNPNSVVAAREALRGAKTTPDSVILVRTRQNSGGVGDDDDDISVEYFNGNVTSQDDEGYTALFDCDILGTQDEFVFLINAYDVEGNILSAGEVTLQIADIEVSEGGWWVGAEAGNGSASLRVKAGVSVTSPTGLYNNKHCQISGVCYVLEVGGGQGVAPEACQSIENIDICTEEAISFTGFPNGVNVSVSGGVLEVSVGGKEGGDEGGWPGILEVLAYDPEDTKTTLTDIDLVCQSEEDSSTTTSSSQNNMCVQPLLVKNVAVMTVLVVGLDKSGQNVEASAILSVIGPSISSGTEPWVIVVSVLSSVLGAALIAFAIVVVVKKYKSKKAVRSGGDAMSKRIINSESDDHIQLNHTNPMSNPTQQQQQPPYAQQQQQQQPPYAQQQQQQQPLYAQQQQLPYARSESSKIYDTPYNQQQQRQQPPSRPPQYPPRSTQPTPRPAPEYDEWGSRPLGMLANVTVKPNAPQPPPPSQRYDERPRY